jgi:hypothetical protein
MRFASLPLAVLASVSLLLAAPAQAALLVDPVGGTSVTFGDPDEGSSGPINLGFNFNFFGTSYSQAYINTNGNLTFGGTNPSGFNTRLGQDVTFPMIAAFYDDLVVGPNGSVSYLSTPQQFVVTWNNLDVFLGATESVTAQAVLGSDGSVVFSYGNVSSDGEATIGITNGLTGSNARFASLSYLGTNPDGTILDSQLSLLSTANSFVPVPEPSSALATIGFGLFGGAFFRRRRQA